MKRFRFASVIARLPHLRLAICFALVIATSLVAAPTATLVAAEGTVLLGALNSIRAGELQAHVNVLADDQLEGREAGSSGGQAAGNYLAQHFSSAGLRGGGDDDSYFQMFDRGFRNVIGILEGSDPELKREYVLLGAHYDHVGYGNRSNSYGPTGHIHNGADDNASGTAGILETIDAFSGLPTPPRRSVVFVLWDGEEKGLLGSKHFLEHPTIPLQQLVFAVNVDMIGRLRNQRLMIFGSRTGWGLRRLVSTRNDTDDVLLDFSWEMKPNSDHFPFYSRGFPILMFHTDLHDDLHRPSDDADKINSAGMQDVTRLLLEVIYELADREKLSGFREACRQESKSGREGLEWPLPPTPPRLGIRWKNGPIENGVVLSAVESGSPADKAGLRVGDRLVQFDHHPITDATQFHLHVLAASSLITALVQREGEAEPREVSVPLAGKPTRLGIAWREDDAEPKTVILSRVVPGSPA
ncbi:MAG: M20/M25/M40 family metallo-hydrolase, partial [Pirellulaceae bacterium]